MRADNAFYTSRSGTPSLNIGILSRYMHTSVEVIDTDDLDSVVALLGAIAEAAGEVGSFAVEFRVDVPLHVCYRPYNSSDEPQLRSGLLRIRRKKPETTEIDTDEKDATEDSNPDADTYPFRWRRNNRSRFENGEIEIRELFVEQIRHEKPTEATDPEESNQ